MAAGGIGLVIKIAAETKQAVGDIKDVDRALENTGTTTSKTSKLMSGMGAAVPIIGAIAAAAVGAAAAMVDMAKAAWEDHQEAEKLAQTLGKIPGITQTMIDANEEWITRTMFATHVLDTDLREAVGQLTLATGDLTEAQKLAALAADVATGANEEFSTVVDWLTKAVGGKTTALQKNMPWLDANKDGTLELSEAMDGLTTAYGGAASAAAANDPWTTIQIIFDELKESLGKWILPLFEKLGEWFADPKNQKKIQEFVDKLGDMAYKLGEKLLPYLEDFLEWLSSPEGQRQIKNYAKLVGDIAHAFMDVVGAIMRVIEWMKKIPYDKIAEIITLGKWETRAIVPAPGGGVGVTPHAGTPGGRSAAGVTINFYGPATDPEGTARAIERTLRGSTWRNARTRTAEPAW